ncbi:MAG: hypothetical protein WC851_02525 [Candidatus Shapirobacteria bacterium]
MKTLTKFFSYYTKFLKKVTTILGTFFIYFIAIFIGRIIYTFTLSETSDHWQKFHSGTSSSKMY